ncbi:hypothetical protein Celaphus_00011889 [Cervus elaphus hippelaphus]|uniref:Uncharacterized protein n=1 Tax=Cervus elaphus hippelaphus TaxID=46360 RepID=A0A212CL30_CEREH|nr:hypothetical protein Celaphus_00011889 [Cervus elaphus hippelaphus]
MSLQSGPGLPARPLLLPLRLPPSRGQCSGLLRIRPRAWEPGLQVPLRTYSQQILCTKILDVWNPYSQGTVVNMWFDGIMTNRSIPALAFGSVAVKARETDSTVKRSVKKSAFKDE